MTTAFLTGCPRKLSEIKRGENINRVTNIKGERLLETTGITGIYWRLLEITGNYWKLLEITGDTRDYSTHPLSPSSS